MYLSLEKDGLNSMTKGEIERVICGKLLYSYEIVKRAIKALPKIQVTGKNGEKDQRE